MSEELSYKLMAGILMGTFYSVPSTLSFTTGIRLTYETIREAVFDDDPASKVAWGVAALCTLTATGFNISRLVEGIVTGKPHCFYLVSNSVGLLYESGRMGYNLSEEKRKRQQKKE